MQKLATLNLLDKEDSGGSDTEHQENAYDWELSVSKEELSSEDEAKNAPDLCSTSDTTTLPARPNSDLSPVSSNAVIADRTIVEEIANIEIK